MVTNTHHSRTFTDIYFGPTGNIQGILKVFDLNTGVVKKPWTMAELPISDWVITLLKKWSTWSNREDTQPRLKLLNRHNQKFEWEMTT